MTFSFRESLDIRHRFPDRLGQGVADMAGDNPLRQGFLSPGAARTALVAIIRGISTKESCRGGNVRARRAQQSGPPPSVGELAVPATGPGRFDDESGLATSLGRLHRLGRPNGGPKFICHDELAR
jgi:hypothetical protein